MRFAGDRWRGSSRYSVVHRTVRCTPDSPVNFSGLAVGVFPKLASSWGCSFVAHRTLSGVHRTVRWIIAESPLEIPEGGEFELESSGASDTVRWCTGHCPVYTGQSGVPRPEGLRLLLCFMVESKTRSFYWLSVNLLHLYNLCTRANKLVHLICVGQFNHQNHWGTRCRPISLSISPFLVIDANTNQSKYRSA